MGVGSESEGEKQFSFLNLFTRALPFFAAVLSIYWLLAKVISNAHMLHKPSSRLQILLLWSNTLSDTHSAAGISERVSISFQRLPPWVYRALTLHSRATPSIVSQIIVHRSWFSGKITFLRQTLRQHVPRLNWKQSSKGMKRYIFPYFTTSFINICFNSSLLYLDFFLIWTNIPLCTSIQPVYNINNNY